MNKKVTLTFHDITERPEVSTMVLVITEFGSMFVIHYSKKHDAFNAEDKDSKELVKNNKIDQYVKYWADLEEINL